MILETVGAIVGVISAAVGTWIAIDARRKPRLNVGLVRLDWPAAPAQEILVHKADVSFSLGEPNPLVVPVVITNTGRKTARSVRIVLRFPGEIKIVAHDATFTDNPTQLFNNHEVSLAVGDMHPGEQRVLRSWELTFPSGCFYPTLRLMRPNDHDLRELMIIWIERFRVDCSVHHDDAEPSSHQLFIKTEIDAPTEYKYDRPDGSMNGGFRFVGMPHDAKEIALTFAEKIRMIKEEDRNPLQLVLWDLAEAMRKRPEIYDAWYQEYVVEGKHRSDSKQP